jgi:hypothetical protein
VKKHYYRIGILAAVLANDTIVATIGGKLLALNELAVFPQELGWNEGALALGPAGAPFVFGHAAERGLDVLAAAAPAGLVAALAGSSRAHCCCCWR